MNAASGRKCGLSIGIAIAYGVVVGARLSPMRTAATAETRFEAGRTLPRTYGSIGMATPLVIETVRTLAQTRRCLAESHRCVALSRRLLNPAWGISGAADLAPHASIRERLERGTLAAASRLVGGGWGTGQPCIVCEQLIAPSEIASGSFQEDGSRVWTHLSCLRIWQAETAAHERRQIAKERRVHGELCALVRRGFASGTIEVLPHNESRLEQGLVGSCSVCQQPVSPDETAYEVTGGVQQPPAYAHPTCHRVWWIESMARRKMQS